MKSPQDKSTEGPRNKSIDIAGIPSGKAVEVPAGNLAGAPGDALPEPAGEVSKRDTRNPEPQEQ